MVLVLPFWWKRRGAGSMVRRAFWLALLAGVSYGVDTGLWSTGITMTGVANPTLLANTTPVWVGLGSMLLFRERLGPGFWAGLALAMAGAALILGLVPLAVSNRRHGLALRPGGWDFLRRLFSGWTKGARKLGYNLLFLDSACQLCMHSGR